MAWCALQGDIITACRSIRSFTGPALMSLLSGTSAQPSGTQLPAARVSEPWESTGPFPASEPHRKVTLNGFIEWDYCVYLLLFFLVRHWIVIRRLNPSLDSCTALGQSAFCLCAPVYLCYLLCACALLVLTAIFIKTEVVSWKYLHNTRLEETPTAL